MFLSHSLSGLLPERAVIRVVCMSCSQTSHFTDHECLTKLLTPSCRSQRSSGLSRVMGLRGRTVACEAGSL
eukprot:749779-Hanusia_phi.AAC.1